MLLQAKSVCTGNLQLQNWVNFQTFPKQPLTHLPPIVLRKYDTNFRQKVYICVFTNLSLIIKYSNINLNMKENLQQLFGNFWRSQSPSPWGWTSYAPANSSCMSDVQDDEVKIPELDLGMVKKSQTAIVLDWKSPPEILRRSIQFCNWWLLNVKSIFSRGRLLRRAAQKLSVRLNHWGLLTSIITLLLQHISFWIYIKFQLVLKLLVHERVSDFLREKSNDMHNVSVTWWRTQELISHLMQISKASESNLKYNRVRKSLIFWRKHHHWWFVKVL